MDKTPQGGEIYDFEPAKLPQEFLAALGQVSASASHTDSIVEMAIAGMLGIDGEQGYAVTAHMSAPLRTSVLKAAAEIKIDNPKALDELDVLLQRIADAMGARNQMLHGSWAIKPSTGEVMLIRQEARTHVEITSRPVTVDEIKLKALALYDAGIDLMRFLIALDLVPALPKAGRKRGVNTPSARKAARKKNGK